MLTIFAMAAALALGAQDAGEWQDFGAGPDGVRVSVNVDSIERGAEGAEAMVRLRQPGATGTGAVQSDILFSFDCAGRRATRRLYVEHRANGEISARSDNGEPMPPIEVAANTPLDQVRELACSIAG